ncbi:branched-chain amino acid transport system II carrier protein, partial [Lactobacillus sp. XV13L]|nr:branched-chain amino acid transport system II carrier protein [Lactobacillus sp. XV13L]
ATTLGKFKLSADGGVAFTQLVNFYLGRLGQVLLAVLIVLTCLTTAVGLVAAFAQDFYHHFPKISYHTWLFLTCLASFGTANFGLDTIIAWSTPLLMFLYPFAMVLILLSILSPLFHRDVRVYGWSVALTAIAACLDMVAAFPPVISQTSWAKALISWQQQYLPFANVGMDWVVPAALGAIIGLAFYFGDRYHRPVKAKKYAQQKN